MSTVQYTTRDKKYVLRIHTALHGFLLAFGQDIMYAVKQIPPGLPIYGHSSGGQCHSCMYGTPGKEMYITFTADGWKTSIHYRLFT